MWAILTDGTRLLAFANVVVLSVVVILAFSLLAYNFTYSFRVSVARRFSLLLALIMVVYSSEVAITRVVDPLAAARWLRFEWLGIALMPFAYYIFSLAVLETTNFRLGRRRLIALLFAILSILSAIDAFTGNLIVEDVRVTPLLAYLESGPLFWVFAAYFAIAVALALQNVLKARGRCLTENSRRRMNFLLAGFIAPGIGVFPYLIALSRLADSTEPSRVLFALSIAGNIVVAVMLVIMSYTVSYFGVLTPDRVVRYRMVRFLLRGPAVAILVILAIQTVPTIEGLLGLPTNIVLFSVITGVIVCSQLFLSVSKSLVDRLIYRGDQDEVAWLREIDRHLLTRTDLRQFLENHLVAMCELLRVESGFVAAVDGNELMLESLVGPESVGDAVVAETDWIETYTRARKEPRYALPVSEKGFWLWPLQERNEAGDGTLDLGMIGVQARTQTPLLSIEEVQVIDSMIERITSALVDRRVQASVVATLRTIIPDVERIQRMRNVIPYAEVDSAVSPARKMLEPSPIYSPEFEAWVKDALSHYWGGPKLTQSPLLGMRMVSDTVGKTDDDPTKALRVVLGSAIDRLRPEGKQSFTAPEWLLYNILEMRFIQGRRVREIADRLAMSESDLYRKQRVAIGNLARVLSEMEEENATSPDATAAGNVASSASAPDPVHAGPSHPGASNGGVAPPTESSVAWVTEPLVATTEPDAGTQARHPTQ